MKVRRLASSFAYVLLSGCSFQASCGTGKNLNMTNAQKFVRETLAADVGVTPTVDCPARVRVEKGGRFDCTASFDGAKAVVTLEQKDDEGFVTVTAVKGVLITHKLQKVISEKFAAASKSPLAVDCGPPVRPATPGDKFECTAKAEGDTAHITVTVKDDTGNVDFALTSVDHPPGADTPPPAPEAPAPDQPPPSP